MEAKTHTLKVSLIATVKNEADTIALLLDSMVRQSYVPHEIIINDNGSTDQTVDIIKHYIAQGYNISLVCGTGSISAGRNRAIQQAQGDIIACCDAGVKLPSHWLKAITRPLLRREADVGAGFTTPQAHSLWELALGATTYPDVADVNPATYLPGGRSMAFTRSAWQATGGFPEWAYTGEDLVFDFALQSHGFRFVFIPEASVLFRPRQTPLAYFYQYFSYAVGDGIANLWPGRHAIRYTAYGCFMYLLKLLLEGAVWPLGLLGLGVVIHTWKPYRRLWGKSKNLRLVERVMVLSFVPFIRFLGDIAKMIGYPVGLWRRRACL